LMKKLRRDYKRFPEKVNPLIRFGAGNYDHE